MITIRIWLFYIYLTSSMCCGGDFFCINRFGSWSTLRGTDLPRRPGYEAYIHCETCISTLDDFDGSVTVYLAFSLAGGGGQRPGVLRSQAKRISDKLIERTPYSNLNGPEWTQSFVDTWTAGHC